MRPLEQSQVVFQLGDCCGWQRSHLYLLSLVILQIHEESQQISEPIFGFESVPQLQKILTVGKSFQCLHQHILIIEVFMLTLPLKIELHHLSSQHTVQFKMHLFWVRVEDVFFIGSFLNKTKCDLVVSFCFSDHWSAEST